ncbi:hypothetical protein PPYR_10207 [Photinus pyralis]|uniref:Trimethylguanosine synthase n=1 Tax=Photinus pyralis TaxID=7054 RepID=A0A5N4AFS6_PHOPY|nr:trimethylguanosine synthase [Photinus pyralis]KAB0796146.1 hypothetical protein PPYR_10207 [Photinus pyralis]
MYDSEWAALAVFHFNKKHLAEEIYCLCSRVFTWNCKYDLQDNPSEECANENIEELDYEIVPSQLIEQGDNCDLNWHDYWALNGERLIWESWIAKYSSYINPEFTQTLCDQSSVSKQSSLDKPESACSLKLSFDSASPHLDSSDYSATLECSISNEPKHEVIEKNRMLVRNLSGSESYDKLNREGEGWNPLSPLSNDYETEIERLITSRCDSHTGSSSRTVDSMTNVTRMTVSSIDLSESSKSSESFSSVSSVQSSLTSTSSEEVDDTATHEHEWNDLWAHHYEQEYYEHYKKFAQNSVQNHKSVTEDKSHDEDTNLLSSILSLMRMDETNEDDCSVPNQMNLMGLPTSFGSRKLKKAVHTPRSNVKKGEQSSRDQIRAAFNLIGMRIQESNSEALVGSFDYKMKNIQRQNDMLKMNKHIRFDDDGLIIPEEDEVTVQNSHQDELLGIIPSSSTEDEAETGGNDLNNETNRRNRKRRKKRKRKLDLPLEIAENPKLRKFWQRRYTLFSKFDEGIRLDEESWFSVTPELIAKNTARRLRCDVVIDAFCGAGGNTIQLAQTCNRVIAIDIDVNKINFAKHNAEIYKVADRIEFIVGDFFQLAKSLKGDVVFLSPPWGGPEYLNRSTYDLEYLQPRPLTALMEAVRKVTQNVCLFLPRNCNTYQLITAAGPGGRVELEQNFLNKKLVALTAYFGNLIKEV